MTEYIVKVTRNCEGTFDARAMWIPGYPPEARCCITITEALVRLQNMIERDPKYADAWPQDGEVTVDRPHWIYTSRKQPRSWFFDWTNVTYCPECAAANHGHKFISTPILCIYCGYRGMNFIDGAARLKPLPRKWWQWQRYKEECR